jgi:hypothetical protein
VSPALYQAIIYEENSHQFPPFGGEREIEDLCPQCVKNGIGVMQVSSRTSGFSNKALLNDATNVSAGGAILQSIQTKYGTNPAVVGAYYNSGTYGPALQQSANYGQRVNSYATGNLSTTFGDTMVRGGVGATTGSLSSVLSSLSAALVTLSGVLRSMPK